MGEAFCRAFFRLPVLGNIAQSPCTGKERFCVACPICPDVRPSRRPCKEVLVWDWGYSPMSRAPALTKWMEESRIPSGDFVEVARKCGLNLVSVTIRQDGKCGVSPALHHLFMRCGNNVAPPWELESMGVYNFCGTCRKQKAPLGRGKEKSCHRRCTMAVGKGLAHPQGELFGQERHPPPT